MPAGEVHAFDCDLDVDCSCHVSNPPDDEEA